MAFVIDDIAIVAAETAVEAAEVAAETTGEVTATTAELVEEVGQSAEILGDGIGEASLNIEEVETMGEVTDMNSEVLGDGIGETALNTEEIKAVSEVTDVTSEVLGDGLEEDSLKITDNVSEAITKYDDNGKPFMSDGKLMPNNEYELNGYRYTTDTYGRKTKVEGNFYLPDDKEPRVNLPKIEGCQPGDDRGHLVAYEFGGANNEGNLVPMNSEMNRFGDFRNWEREVKQALKEGKDVSATNEINYVGNSSRPTSFTITTTIDGEISERTFLNK